MGIKIGEYKLYFNREVLKLILTCQVEKRDCERSLMRHINTTKIWKHEILEAMKKTKHTNTHTQLSSGIIGVQRTTTAAENDHKWKMLKLR